MVVMLHDDHWTWLQVTLHPSPRSLSIYLSLLAEQVIRLPCVKRQVGQVGLVTSLTGQRSGAVPCCSRCGFNFSFFADLKIHKQCTSGADYFLRFFSLYFVFFFLSRSVSPLNAVCSTQPAGRSEGSEPAAARRQQRHSRGGEGKEVSLWWQEASFPRSPVMYSMLSCSALWYICYAYIGRYISKEKDLFFLVLSVY